jgi:hypothetical protein
MLRTDRLTQGLRRGAACLMVLAWATGCQVYDPSLVEGDAGGSGECDLRRPPPRPDVEDGDDGMEYVYGLREVVLDQSGEAWREIGYDLDGLCTTSESFATECVPPGRPRPPTDGNEGIDNTFGDRLFPLVDLTVPGLQQTARAAQDEGKLPALRMRGWNGEPDDPRVDVAITNAIFVVPAAPDGTVPEFEIREFFAHDPDTGERLLPEWDGTDYGFFRDETFFEGDPDQPLLRDDNAYVSNRTVVARLPERVEILFPAQEVGVLVRLTDATAVGTLSEDLQTIDDVVVAGRWSVLDLLSTAENVGVCRGTDNYRILSSQLDTIADIRSMPGSGGEGVRCDAVSMGVAFRGYRMRWGGLTSGPPLRNVCTEGDGGVPMLDGGTGTDAGALDAGVDAGSDAGVGGGTDAGVDAGTDGGSDGGDAGVDGG